MKKINLAIIYIVIFMLASLLPIMGIAGGIGITDKKNNSERRVLASFPILGPNLKLKDFPKAFDGFFDDNLGFRKWMIHTYGAIKLFIFKTPPNSTDIIGKDNWIFYDQKAKLNPDFKGYYRNLEFSDKQLKVTVDKLVAERDWLKKRNIPYILVIVPNKELIYSEFYPDPENYAINNLRLKQFSDYLKKNTDLDFIYLKEALKEAKNNSKLALYYQRDTHWNGYGSLFGYLEIMKHFKKYSPAAQIFSMEDFDVSVEANRTGDLMRVNPEWGNKDTKITLSLKKELTENAVKFHKVYVYGDSFSDLDNGDPEPLREGLNHFFRFSFDEVKNSNFATPLEYKEIEKDEPDLVVRESVQSSLYGW